MSLLCMFVILSVGLETFSFIFQKTFYDETSAYRACGYGAST